MVAANRKATEPRVPSGKVQVITSNVLRSPPWLLIVREYLCHKWARMCFVCRNHNPVLSSFTTYHWVCNRVTRWVAHVEQKLLTLPERPSSPSVFNGVGIARLLVFCVWYFVDHCLSFFFWAFYCLSFFDLRLLITALVFSNFSYIPEHRNNNRTPSIPEHRNNNRTPSIPEHRNNNRTPSIPEHRNNNRTPSIPEDRNNNRTPSIPEHRNNNRTPSIPEHRNNNRTPFIPEHRNNNRTPSISEHRNNNNRTPSIPEHRTPSKNNNRTPSIPEYRNNNRTPSKNMSLHFY